MYRLFFLLLIFPLCASAQATLSTKNKKAIAYYTEADNYRVRGQYAEALELLNMAIEKDDRFAEAYYRMGLVYFSQKKIELAIQNFEKGLSLTADQAKHKVYWYDLGESYLSIGDYKKAEHYLNSYLQVENRNKRNISRATTMLNSARYAVKNQGEGTSYNTHRLPDEVNAFGLQYFPVLTADQKELIFTKRNGNDPNDDEDLVVCRLKPDGTWSSPVSISNNINSELNEGTCTISADGRKLIFTSCIGRQGYGSCDLYESIKIGDEWSKPRNLGPLINSSDWESQPSLSADGRTLYFVSERRGGYGLRDIWLSHLDLNDHWTQAVNAGSQINSQYDEISPFIHANNKTFYFASNGLPGFGGYDIFFLERTLDGWTKPQNVGNAINNHHDQFSLFITADGKRGYYVDEERIEDGSTASKIFVLEIPEDHRVKFRSNYVTGVVTDKTTGEKLSARIELININQDMVESIVKSDSVNGQYLMVLTQGAEYALYVNKPGYLFESKSFNYSEVSDFEPITLHIELEKIRTGSAVVLRNIFFDTDKYELKEKSKTELQKVITTLEENPKIKIEISGHTDNQGSSQYNYSLSEKRALAVLNYLKDNGIDKSRLTIKGYGADKPVASNDTESGRQQNRRIELKVIN